MNKSESKYFNTAVRMDKALMALLVKKDFEYITVKEICLEADVNRSTFYLHYENTRELLEEAIAYMQKEFWSYFSDTSNFASELSNRSRSELMLITPEYLLPYLNFISDHRRLYIAAMKNPSNFRSEAIYEQMFRDIFNPILQCFSVPEERRSYIMAFYLNGIGAIVSEWLRGDCRDSAEFIADAIINCIPSYKES